MDHVVHDFLDALNPARLLVTMLAALVFGFFALGTVLASPAIAKVLGEVQYSKQVAKAIFVVSLVFTVPQIILSVLGLDGPLGRALAGPVLWGIFCVALDMSIRLRVHWTIWRSGRSER